jgi:catechol 2,3-dioxygenase-like lactoylglutathione lyase family enzyme
MIDHVSLGVSDLEISGAFYDAVLDSLGMTRLVTRATSIGYGKRYPEVWLNLRRGMPRVGEATGVHLCLRARSEHAVRAFHAAALAHGGTDDGAPGQRVASMSAYFGAFVRDPDGNKLEAATFPAG